MSCGSNDDEVETVPVENGTVISEVAGKVGIMHYDGTSKEYYLYCHKEGTVDVVDIYYIMNPSDSIRQENAEYVFSGRLYKRNTTEAAPAGTSRYNIYLTSIALR